MILTEKDHKTTIEVEKDSEVEIILHCNPSTGYKWKHTETEAAVLNEAQHKPVEKPRLGQPHNIHFKFKILDSGIIQLFYARHWHKTQPPAKCFEVNINIINNT